MEQQQPLTVAQVVSQSDVLIERRRLNEARALLSTVLKAHPDSEELLYRFALIDYLEENDEDALATIARLLSTTPAHYGARFIQAEILERRNRWVDAENVWLELIRDFPETADLYAAYARLMLSTLNLDKARRLASEALRFEPEHHSALYVMAIADLITGQQHGQHRRHLEMLVRELTIETHWSMVPLYPMRRWGWAGAIGIWGAAVIGLNALEGLVPSSVLGILLVIWFTYVVYSWVWPTQLKRLI
jgi:tetratricopeptide (TPR) repeat protein